MCVYTRVYMCVHVCVCMCVSSRSFIADTDLNPTFKELGLVQEMRHVYK